MRATEIKRYWWCGASRWRFLICCGLCTVWFAGCSDPVCVPGASLACACTNGLVGAQLCTPEEMLAPCTCDEPDPDQTIHCGVPEQLPEIGGKERAKSRYRVGERHFTDIAAGNWFTCGLRANGEVLCWGENAKGQAAPPGGARFERIDAGAAHICGLTFGGVRCWGDNGQGQARVPEGGRFLDVIAGARHTCALREDGTVRCWGLEGDSVGQKDLRPPSGRFVALAGGTPCVKGATGKVQCWLSRDRPSPRDAFKFVASGASHGCGLRTDGTMRCWGSDSYGQARTPVGNQFRDVAVGAWHTCAADSSGTVGCWGDEAFGKSSAPDPREHRVMQLSLGAMHSCGLLGDGRAICWGDNSRGQASPP